MKSKWIIVTILGAALVVVCAGIVIVGLIGLSLFPISSSTVRQVVSGVSVTAIEEKSFTVTGQAMLDLSNTFGDIEISATQDQTSGEIKVTATLTAWGADQSQADEALKKLNVNMTQDGNQVTIKVEDKQASQLSFQGRSSSVDFKITVPTETTTVVRTRSGDVSLEGTQGKTDLNSNFGDIQITNVLGGVAASSNNGKITVRGVKVLDSGFGDISFNSGFGDVSVEDVAVQHGTISSRNGNIHLTNVKIDGPLALSNEFGDLTIDSGQASELNAETRNGNISLNGFDVKEKITLQTDFGDIELSKSLAQSYDLATKNGKVNVDGAQGSLKAYSDFGDIGITNGDQTTLDLETKSGKIEYQGSLGTGPNRLHTEMGDIRIKLPEGSSFAFDLQTDFGKIRSDFPATFSQPDEQHWQGQVGEAGPGLNVSSRNGDVIIEAYKP